MRLTRRVAGGPTGCRYRPRRQPRSGRLRRRRQAGPRRRTARTSTCPSRRGRRQPSHPRRRNGRCPADGRRPRSRPPAARRSPRRHRARMVPVPNRSTQASTRRPSGRIAGWPGWSAKPRSSAGPKVAPPSLLMRRWMLRYAASSKSYVHVNVTKRPSGAIAPRWSQLAIRPVGSAQTVTGCDQVWPSSLERRWTTRWNHGAGSRYSLLDSTLRTSRPSASRRIAFVSDGGPTSAGIGNSRHGVQDWPASNESASEDRHRQAALGVLVEQGLAGKCLAIDPQGDDDEMVAVEGRDRGGLERPTPAIEARFEGRDRVAPGASAIGRAADLDREVVRVLAGADAVGGERLPSARTANAGNVATARRVPGSPALRIAPSTIFIGRSASRSAGRMSGRVDRQPDGLAAGR